MQELPDEEEEQEERATTIQRIRQVPLGRHSPIVLLPQNLAMKKAEREEQARQERERAVEQLAAEVRGWGGRADWAGRGPLPRGPSPGPGAGGRERLDLQPVWRVQGWAGLAVRGVVGPGRRLRLRRLPGLLRHAHGRSYVPRDSARWVNVPSAIHTLQRCY